jgi:predicted enzyme involved in methoxymalonyl-ACP biosynthesis
MSCRVFNRTMENATLNVLKKKAFELDIKVIEIAVKKSPKNNYCLKFFEDSKLKKKLHSSSKTIYTLKPSISIKNQKTKYESKINFKIY